MCDNRFFFGGNRSRDFILMSNKPSGQAYMDVWRPPRESKTPTALLYYELDAPSACCGGLLLAGKKNIQIEFTISGLYKQITIVFLRNITDTFHAKPMLVLIFLICNRKSVFKF